MSRLPFAKLAIAVLLLGTAARAAEFKAAYVDLQRALTEVDEGRQAKARLQRMLDEKQKQLDADQDKLRKEKDLLDKQASAMSEETRVQKQTELQRKLYDLAQQWEKGKAEMAQREHTELQAIFAKMDPIIAKIAQREQFTMVFEKTDSGLVYAPAALDITNELVREFNAMKKGSGGAGEAPKTDTKQAPAKSGGK